jgi:hypothetical protein
MSSAIEFAENGDGTVRGGVTLHHILKGGNKKYETYENRFKDLVVPVALNCQEKRCTRDPLKIPKEAPVIDDATLQHMENLTVGRKPKFETARTRKAMA